MKFLKSGFTREDLLRIDEKNLPVLADEVRAVIVDTVKKNGGHLGSSLGVVELTIAMLRKFDPLNDRIIFDVGHQSYPYKILTDRFDKFSTLRLKDGIAGFPRRSESPCDHFNTGHSSTSISAALGYAKARDLLHEKRHVIAFIGDASLINGLALEALNYVHETGTKLIIILNDNRHSISNRVGGFSTILARLSSNSLYKRFKNYLLQKAGSRTTKSFKIFKKFRDTFKFIIKPHNMFDDLDINYWGPFDGHDIKKAENILELAKSYEKPVILHFNTIKGKGLPEAEADPTKYHQLSPANEKKSRTWSEAASKIAEELAINDEKIICFTAAMVTGVKLEKFAREFPDRFFDVGIAESHMLTMAAGLAAGGMRPWVFIYSTFLQRAMDQLMHDIALQNLPVVIMVDRAGLSGSDGDTHQGVLDISWCRAIPNLEIYAPCDENSLKEAMLIASKRNGPTLIRYPRGSISEKNLTPEINNNGIVKISEGKKFALLAHGAAVQTIIETRELAKLKNFEVPALYDVRKIKPLDFNSLDEILKNFELVATVEENYMPGGLGEAVAARIAESDFNVKLIRFGVPDVCVKHATQDEQREMYGLTPENILSEFEKFLSHEKN
ncbi:MAG: 1-deoxy-D-xylulose-5-phosphate synthase [Synergistaceae bacterium]|nr:1-deoxy-D-xylulose-5-phosphate synthase [Synergistaceae bacterium]